MIRSFIFSCISSGADDRAEFDDFDEEESDYHSDITPREYAQLWRSYGTDQLPITSNFNVRFLYYIGIACCVGVTYPNATKKIL